MSQSVGLLANHVSICLSTGHSVHLLMYHPLHWLHRHLAISPVCQSVNLSVSLLAGELFSHSVSQ